LSSNKKIACPLDCYDTCQGELKDGNIKGSKEHFTTNGKLCLNFANLLKEKYLETAYFDNKKITLDESLDILVEKLKETKPEKSLYLKGAGNLGIMQHSTKSFFSHYGSTFTKGGLCDEAGAEGLLEGRGVVQNPSIENLLNADVIIVWGRDFSVTSSHMYNLVKDKTFITIDPRVTDIASKSALHLQINPKTDYELALMLTRLAFMSNLEDEEYLEENTEGHDWFFDTAKNRPLVSYEATTGVDLDDAYTLFDLIENKKVALMIGLGVQKYFEGAQITRSIDSFATFIGLNNQKDAGGVWYFSDSTYGYEDQFNIKQKVKTTSLIETDFSSYDLVFIQGANPVVSNPNTQSIIKSLENTFVVYFGTTYNDTCKYANLIIPSSSFLSKKDLRLSYGHELKAISEPIEEKHKNSISEYELSSYLLEKFSFEALASEDEILAYYKNYQPRLEEFDEFKFIEDLDIEPLYKEKTEDNFYLITSKSKKSLNSQFAIDNYVYLNESSKFKENDEVKITSKYGEQTFTVKIDNCIKESCAFFYAGNKKVNYLTPNKEDEVANTATFQEVLLDIELS
jgi:anaerobic selenocysteine-containing dehydrogenase